ncbi:hypothetical protein GOBAR_DD14483 [Gossypium barbadense]|nr:hypothetical protein GOBAR_DD14483 [Gossypium barbadense]
MATLPIVELLLLAIIIVVSCIKVQCFDFKFSDFQEENRKDLLLSKNSTIFRDAIQITPDLNGDIKNTPGRAFYGKKFKLWSKTKGKIASFNTTFVINISNKDSPEVGEGLAFVLSADSNVPQESFGQWLGIVNATTNGTSRARIVGVEFDTRKSYEEEPDGNHVGLDINSCYSIEQQSLSGYGVNLSMGVDVRVVVQYDGKNMTVFVSNGSETQSSNPVLSVPVDLSSFLPETVHVGFSASTGNFTELNCVRAWEFHGDDVGDDSNLLWVWIVIPILVLGLILGLGIYWRRRSKKDDLERGYANIQAHIKSSTAPTRFKLRELKRATGNFNHKNKLGKGGFGTVYKGVWKEKEIAVKRVSKKSHQGNQEFIAEVTTIGNLNHKNLVKLIGWCYENRELLLVYEYMPNGSLDKFIFYDEKTGKGESNQPNLSWETRLIIIQGVAEALDYLHNGCEKRVLHRDVKCSNIMLDSEFNAKLGDFGLARTIQQREKTHHSTIEIAGTPGYMAPETFLISRATVETDVYSYGVLLLEVVCGRKLGNQTTGNFNHKNKLGKGGFGTVYKGVWKEKEIAVKRVSKKSHQGNQEFIAEVTTIGNLNHKNLVKLIGWCYENRELLLVYEYMPNGSLDKFIFYDEKTGKGESNQPNLSWETRLIIIQGVAEALDYLHNGCEKRVLHRDVKCSNIMLDSEFNAKLGDFGLARTIQQREKTHHSTIEIAGTPGYMAPETFLISRATVETDVYSYGVLLLEVVCGRKLGNQSELSNYSNSIVNWLWEYYSKGRITDAADSNLDRDFAEKEVESALILGLACCHPNPHFRPSMKTVSAVLAGEMDPPQVPLERPSFVWPAVPPVFTQSDYSLTGSQSQFSTFSEVDGR